MKKLLPWLATLAGVLAPLTASAAHPDTNPLVFGNNRLTIITPTLLRLEYAHDAAFIDEPTLFAIDRSNTLSTD